MILFVQKIFFLSGLPIDLQVKVHNIRTQKFYLYIKGVVCNHFQIIV